jgi:small subunit ribosomal protein S16
MATKIRLARYGAKKKPFYRIVIADSRTPREGKCIENVGTYNPMLPKTDEKRVVLKTDRIQHWIGVGAQPTETVERLFKGAGIISEKKLTKAAASNS